MGSFFREDFSHLEVGFFLVQDLGLDAQSDFSSLHRCMLPSLRCASHPGWAGRGRAGHAEHAGRAGRAGARRGACGWRIGLSNGLAAANAARQGSALGRFRGNPFPTPRKPALVQGRAFEFQPQAQAGDSLISPAMSDFHRANYFSSRVFIRRPLIFHVMLDSFLQQIGSTGGSSRGGAPEGPCVAFRRGGWWFSPAARDGRPRRAGRPCSAWKRPPGAGQGRELIPWSFAMDETQRLAVDTNFLSWGNKEPILSGHSQDGIVKDES